MRESIALNSVRTLIFRVLSSFLGIVIGVVISRLFGPEGKGIFTMNALVAGLYLVAFGGVQAAIAYQISKEGIAPQRVLANSLLWGAALGLTTSVLVLFTYPWLEANGWWFVLFFGLAAPFSLWQSYLSGAFLGSNDIKSLNYATVLPLLWTLILVVLLRSVFRWGIESALVAWLGGQVFTTLWMSLRARGLWCPWSISSLDASLLRSMLGFGTQIGMVNLIGLLNYRVDVFMIQYFVGISGVGLYSVAVSLAEMLWFLSSAISIAAYARIGRASMDCAADLTARGIRHSLFVVAVAAVLLFLMADPLIPLIYGSRFKETVVPLRIMLPGAAAYGLASIFSAFFTNQLGKPKISLYIAGFSLVVGFLIGILLIPRWGLAGAAWATTISYTMSVMVAVLTFVKMTGFSVPQLLMIRVEDLQDYAKLGRLLVYQVRGVKS